PTRKLLPRFWHVVCFIPCRELSSIPTCGLTTISQDPGARARLRHVAPSLRLVLFHERHAPQQRISGANHARCTTTAHAASATRPGRPGRYLSNAVDETGPRCRAPLRQQGFAHTLYRRPGHGRPR